LNEKGVLVLGIERDKVWVPTPKASEIIKNGDHLVIYGPLDVLKSKLEV
jgi:K+/H+ antiporter YhaU regulatory subunit KhtT